MTTASHTSTICRVCKIGTFHPDTAQFSVERGGQFMVIGNVPALVCGACGTKEFDETISSDLIQEAERLFATSNGRMFAYQFSDFVRPEPVYEFKVSERVRIKDDVEAWDLYDEKLRPGMEGVVIGKGLNRFDYEVAFKLKRGKNQFVVEVELDANDLDPLDSQ